MRGWGHTSWRGAVTAIAFLLAPAALSAQELEPGAYWPIPAGLNILTVVNSFNSGDLSFEPSAPISEANATINTTAFAYTKAFGLAGRSSNAGLVIPVVLGHLEGLVLGAPATADRFGIGDPRLRVAFNIHGAPAMTLQEFATYRQRVIVGASVTVVVPLGEYDPSKLINIGTHRWAFKPEIGLSSAHGKWVVEAMAGAWLFLDNTNFFGGGTRTQDPIGATQLHLTYKFQRGMWLAADANFFTGGRTTVNGNKNLDLQRNSRVGATFSWAFTRHHAIRASVSRGAYTNIGADFTSVAVGYNYAWAP